MIPRLFHQIWLGPEPFPDEFRGYQESWLRENEGWELRFWTEENLPGDLTRTEVYELLRQPAERSDILRLELLERHGGVYLDTDFECLRPLEPLLDGVDFFCAYLKPGRVNNAIIGSVPGHPLLQRGVREVRPRETYGPVDKAGTGPLFLASLLESFPDVTIFDDALFYPRTPETRTRAVAVHHYARSWKAPEALLKDLRSTEERLGAVQDELRALQQRYDRLAAGHGGGLRARLGALLR